MVRGKPQLQHVLRATADRLEAGADYAWTHMGACNCGHVAQTLTGLSAVELRRISQEKPGEWAEQAREHCPTSGHPMDELLSMMVDLGMTLDQVAHLEKLSDPAVLTELADHHGIRRVDINHKNRAHVVAYMRAWAHLHESRTHGTPRVPLVLIPLPQPMAPAAGR
jgi:hypothetical protein